MYRNEMDGPRRYVVLLFVNVDRDYYALDHCKREELSAPHIKQLSEYLKTVSVTSLQTTGLTEGSTMIEILESENLADIEAMIETYKAGAKAKYGVIEKVIVSEKTMVREMTG